MTSPAAYSRFDRLVAAWDHFVTEAAHHGYTVDPAVLIESGALGRAVTLQDPPAVVAEVAYVRSAS